MKLTEIRAARRQKAEEMAEKYKAGATLMEIGDFYGVTRERVRQLMTQELGITAVDGGAARRANDKRRAAKARRDLVFLRKYGMTEADYKRVQKRLMPNGKPPKRAFDQQKKNAFLRGIEWNLTFGEWWLVWRESGKWDQRGRGKKCYVMARHSDSGPYDIGNVKIIPCGQNNSEYIRRYWKEVREGKRPPPKKPKAAKKRLVRSRA